MFNAADQLAWACENESFKALHGMTLNRMTLVLHNLEECFSAGVLEYVGCGPEPLEQIRQRRQSSCQYPFRRLLSLRHDLWVVLENVIDQLSCRIDLSILGQKTCHTCENPVDELSS